MAKGCLWRGITMKDLPTKASTLDTKFPNPTPLMLAITNLAYQMIILNKKKSLITI